MLSFFTRKPFIYNNLNSYSNLSKYIINTTNRIKENTIQQHIIPKNVSLTVIEPTYYNLIPVISMLSFLAGYYLSNK
jgi:hypothetical protein